MSNSYGRCKRLVRMVRGSGDVLRNGQIGRRKTQLTSESASVLHNAFDQNPFHQIFSVSLRTSRNCEKNSLAKTRSTV